MAFPRPLAGILLIAGAAGGPYLLFETDAGKSAQELAESAFSENANEPVANGWFTSAEADLESGIWNANGSDLQVTMPGESELDAQQHIHALREVLRFDVTPEWVPQRFARVSTVKSDSQLDGLRVPLITGTTPSDLAGTLTYYFDRYKRLQRIKVHAVVGDPRRVQAELQHAFRFQQQPSLGGTLHTLKWNGRPTSIIYTAQASVITADSQYGRYNMFIELNQAGLEYGLSPESQQLIAQGQQTNRWN